MQTKPQPRHLARRKLTYSNTESCIMNFHRIAAVIVFLGLLGVSLPQLQACLWDHDTLLVERGRFPQTLELITGKFLRHSTEFYRWRIADRERQIFSADPEDPATAKALRRPRRGL